MASQPAPLGVLLFFFFNDPATTEIYTLSLHDALPISTPANMVKRVTSQLIDRGKVTRGWIGVAMEPLTTELAQALGLHDTQGAVVARVYPGGPAAIAGLVQNDVIVTFDGTPVEDYHHLQRLSADAGVGKTITLGVVRSRERRTLDLRIAEAPERAADTTVPSQQPR